jgi:DNA polymerase-1
MEAIIKDYPEKVWVGFDWKQAEMYFLCLFSKDLVLKQALTSQDFHKFVASSFMQVPMEDITPDQRELAKTVSFQLIYSGFNLGMTRSNILRKRPDLDEDQVSDALDKYQETFFCLFNWVNKTVIDWFNNEGYLTYFMGAKKFIPVPIYFKEDSKKILNSKEGRLCVNTKPQNSVGLLLKYVISNMFRDEEVRNYISQIIPIFDAIYILVDTDHLYSVMGKINRFATPVLRHDNFEMKMAVDWKLSLESWGDMHKIDFNPSSNGDSLIYEW